MKEKNKIKISKLQIFQVLTIVLAVALVGSFALKQTGCLIAGDANSVGQKTVNFINNNLLPPGIEAKFLNSASGNGVYKVSIEIQGQTNDIYVSGDGKLLFPTAIDMSQTMQQPTQPQQQNEPFDAPDAETPTVRLFVMSFCPYGQQAENAMVDVVKLFGDKVAIEPHFIVSVVDGKVNSLHGEYEANENMRQACIWKNYGSTTFWNYIEQFNGVCNKDNLDTCWKEKAEAVGIDTTVIENCVATEGISLMEADQALTEQYNVRGSPTLIINDAEYYGERTSEAFKDAICSGFSTPIAECEQTLSEEGTQAAGAC